MEKFKEAITMKDMTIVLNKKIINKETNEVRLVISIDEAERKIFLFPLTSLTLSQPAWPQRALTAAGNSTRKLRPLRLRSPRALRPRPLK